jgi:hypothetical protein
MDHPNYKVTFDRIRNIYANVTEEDCQKFVSDCVRCQKASSIKRGFDLIPVVAMRPNCHWQVDCVNLSKYKLLNDGYVGFMTVVDVFSRFCWLTKLQSFDGKSVANGLFSLFCRETPPLVLQSDNGRELTNENVKRLLKTFTVQFRNSSPYHPTSQGKCERLNQTIVRKLSKMMCDPTSSLEELEDNGRQNSPGGVRTSLESEDNPNLGDNMESENICSRSLQKTGRSRWVEHTELAEMLYNSSKHRGTGMSPFECHRGLICNFFYRPPSDSDDYAHPSSQFTQISEASSSSDVGIESTDIPENISPMADQIIQLQRLDENTLDGVSDSARNEVRVACISALQEVRRSLLNRVHKFSEQYYRNYMRAHSVHAPKYEYKRGDLVVLSPALVSREKDKFSTRSVVGRVKNELGSNYVLVEVRTMDKGFRDMKVHKRDIRVFRSPQHAVFDHDSN